MVKIRLMGINEECREVIDELVQSLNVQSVSKAYPNRDNRSVRYYVDVRTNTDDTLTKTLIY